MLPKNPARIIKTVIKSVADSAAWSQRWSTSVLLVLPMHHISISTRMSSSLIDHAHVANLKIQ